MRLAARQLPRRGASIPTSLVSVLRGDLDWIIMKAMEKDRTRRYETANGLARDVERYLASEQVTAVAPSAAYLLSKYWRRHKRAITTALAITGLLITGTVVSIWLAITCLQRRTPSHHLSTDC